MYSTSKPVDYGLLYSDQAWKSPLIANNWPTDLRSELILLYEHRETLFRIMERSARIPSHLDFWPNNVAIDDGGSVVLFDWAFFGDGATGEDIGNFIPDAVFDGFVGPDTLRWMEQHLVTAYMDGLAAGGLTFEPRAVTRAVHASAVKYVWLGPLLIERASGEIHQSYGGHALDDANEQYAYRGATLAYLCAWARQALQGD